MTDKRMSEERLEELLKTAYDSEFYAMDISECARENKALKAELTAARTVTDGEVAKWINYLHGTDPLPENYDVELDDLLTRLSASYSAACGERDAAQQVMADQAKAIGRNRELSEALSLALVERDRARADALEEAAKVFDAIPDETELSPEHWQTDPDSGARVKFGKTTKRAALRPSSVAARIRALKPVQGEQ